MVIYGVDVSSHKPVSNINAVKAAGNDFLITKATGGITYVNPIYQDQIDKARSVGMAVGHFHYLHESTLDGASQAVYRSEARMAAEAEHFLRHLDLREGELVALDVEDPNVTGNLSPCTLFWCRYVEERLGFPPLIYTYPYYIKERSLTDPALTRYPLWYAEYNEPMQNSPAPWPRLTLRQYTASATVPGIGKDVDRNTFAGTIEQLRALGKPVALPPDAVVQPPSADPPVVTAAIDWDGTGTVVASGEYVVVRNSQNQTYIKQRTNGAMGGWIETTLNVKV